MRKDVIFPFQIIRKSLNKTNYTLPVVGLVVGESVGFVVGEVVGFSKKNKKKDEIKDQIFQ